MYLCMNFQNMQTDFHNYLRPTILWYISWHFNCKLWLELFYKTRFLTLYDILIYSTYYTMI